MATYTPNYNRMQAAVSAAQKQRATVAGPPSPMMTSGVNVSAQMPTQLNGVEMQTAAQRPTLPTINTSASDRVAKLGMMSQPNVTAPSMAAGASAQPAMPMPSAAVAVNPLGGMDARSLSARSGPMGYSPKGVGTNNPNSYAVGKNNKNFSERMGPMGQPPSASPQMIAPAQMMAPQGQPQGAPAERDDAFWAGQAESSARFQTEQANARALTAERDVKEQADKLAREQMMQVTTTQIPGTDYIIPFAGSKAMGTLPIQKPDAPIPAGLVPQGAVRDGVQYGPAKQAPNPTRLTPIPGAPSIIQGGTPTPDRVFDPYTGVFYEAGQVPGRGTAQAPAAAAPPAAAGSAAAPAKKSRFMDLLNQR
jgi:hypothetical protein